MMAFKTILSSVLLVLNLMVGTTNTQSPPKPTVKATTQTITWVKILIRMDFQYYFGSHKKVGEKL
jgi:hypothetical protein